MTKIDNMKATTNGKPLASLSLDLDNQWSYMKTYGDDRWKTLPSYFEVFLPPFFDLLDQYDLKITFFIVGQDAALPKNSEYLQEITKRGHEVGNHSFRHEPWICMNSKEQLGKEILETENHIIQATGQKPIGFRGPGYSWGKNLLNILSDNDYIYDASVLPTYIGSLARQYYFRTSILSPEEKKHRKDLFGQLKDGLRPVKPYFWQLSSGSHFLEIPVTTIPLLKIPFHLSYLIYLSHFSPFLMLFYLDVSIGLCKITGTSPSFLLHPIDFIGGDQVPDLSFFPGMGLNREQKMRIFRKVIKKLSRHFRLVNMSTHANAILKNKDLKVVHL